MLVLIPIFVLKQTGKNALNENKSNKQTNQPQPSCQEQLSAAVQQGQQEKSYFLLLFDLIFERLAFVSFCLGFLRIKQTLEVNIT